ncbi:MAG: hypothetical protein DWH91_03660 [Planctomycetota bacterium]|nr:MAG: hypothetical protein DWH91_03660 [Planctomycetota bacterium]
MSPPLYALLIGVNRYQAEFIPPLQGCRNDVELMASILRSRFNLEENHLRILVDEQATHAGIERAFREHLIDRARAAQSSGEASPAFLLHFSGHGSRAVDARGQKVAGVDETMVPYDSRQAGVLDIKDWELGGWLEELAQYSQNITVVLDCCHSGSGTRDIEVATRQCPPDYRPQPTRSTTITPGTRSTGDEGEKPLRHVLLAACSHTESAKEWKDQTPEGERLYGAFTFTLAEELSKTPADNATYRELHQRVVRRIIQRGIAQTPQCEGERDRTLFGGTCAPRAHWICVIEQQGQRVRIDAGSVHGLAVGNELLVFPPRTGAQAQSPSESSPPLARLRVVERGAVMSWCQIVDGECSLEPGCGVQPLQFGSQLLRTVSLARTSSAASQMLEQSLSQPEFAGLIQITQEGVADLSVVSSPLGEGLFDNTEQPLESPVWTTDREQLVRSIRKWARHLNALRIENPSPDSKLRGQVGIEIQLSGGLTIAQSGRIVEAGEQPVDMQLVITNRSDEPLYMNVLAFGYDGSVGLVWPMDGEKVAVPAGKSKTIHDLQLSFPGGRDRTQVRESIKVFATRSPTEFDLLTMNADGQHAASGTRSSAEISWTGPLGELLVQAAQGAGTRLIQPKTVRAEEDWATVELIYQLVRPRHECEQTMQGGLSVAVPGTGSVVAAPAGFMGTLRAITRTPMSSTGEVTRASTVADPFLESLEIVGQRTESFELDADNVARAQITPQTPLRVEWGPAQRGQGAEGEELILAMALDGELCYPVGYAAATSPTLDITWLPPQAEAPSEGVGTRSVAGSLKLYFYRCMKWESGSLGLQRVRWLPLEQCVAAPWEPGEKIRRTATGEVRKRPLNPQEVRPQHNILLLIHGGLGDVESMLTEVGPLVERSQRTYDHVLAFAYETIGTPLLESATQLAQALAGLGLVAGNRVDLMASGMGALVARSAIEMLGADQRVSRCLLAGPPNTGTFLAKSQNLIQWLGTLAAVQSLLTSSGLSPTLAHAASLLQMGAMGAINQASAVRDLQPQSEFLKALNASNPPRQVPYTILAGVAELPPAMVGLARRMADSALSMIFDDEHDMFCSQTSMRTLRNGHFPIDCLQIQTVQADHFTYWTEPATAEHVIEWIRGA